MPDAAASGAPGLLFVAGEASGDLHGAALMEALRSRASLSCFGVGGDRMTAQGLELVAHSRDVGVVGLAEVVRELPRIRGVFHDVLEVARERKPAGAVLIDFPDFNLRLARQLKMLGIPVVYYVSPQIWAWRQGRAKAIAKRVERMLVLFDFEVDFYRGHDVSAVHVGHPIVDEVPDRLRVAEPEKLAGPAKIALLPGSRNSEVQRLLPALLDTVKQLASERELEALLIQAPTVDPSLMEKLLADAGLHGDQNLLRVVREDRLEAIAGCDLTLCASGTATLEVGLLGVPMIVVYRLASLTYAIAKRLVKVDHVALVNLVLEDRVVPELIQDDASSTSIAQAASRLLDGAEERAHMWRRLGRLRGALGSAGASDRAATEVLDALQLNAPPGAGSTSGSSTGGGSTPGGAPHA